MKWRVWLFLGVKHWVLRKETSTGQSSDSEVMMYIACTGECTVLSKYSYHGHVKICIIINVMSIYKVCAGWRYVRNTYTCTLYTLMSWCSNTYCWCMFCVYYVFMYCMYCMYDCAWIIYNIV